MIGPNFTEEIDCGSFFDHIDDLLDFPCEDVEAGLPIDNNCDTFPSIWMNESDSFPDNDPVLSGNSASDLSAELSVPYEDIVQLEWLSNFVDESFSGGGLTINKEESLHPFRTSSPVSVLESSSSCSGEKTAPRSPETVSPGPRGRPRSKRPRPAAFNPRSAIELISPSFSPETPQAVLIPNISSNSENFAECCALIEISKQANSEQKKKNRIKFTGPVAPVEASKNPTTPAVRKCMHCEITKTPQWRAGPMGPKTLCNACGVRYKSGRLFPEYRPAASPTFVPYLHSNSHKKVVEMRSKVGDNAANLVTTGTTFSTSEELNRNSSLPLDCV